jgi:hypothetical protein
MIYLAAPYSHENGEIEHERNKLIDNITMNLVLLGYPIYSPITHGCALVRAAILDDVEIGTDWEAWQSHCYAMLDKADALWVLAIDGWDKSLGIGQEMDYADKKGIPVIVHSEMCISRVLAAGAFNGRG